LNQAEEKGSLAGGKKKTKNQWDIKTRGCCHIQDHKHGKSCAVQRGREVVKQTCALGCKLGGKKKNNGYLFVCEADTDAEAGNEAG